MIDVYEGVGQGDRRRNAGLVLGAKSPTPPLTFSSKCWLFLRGLLLGRNIASNIGMDYVVPRTGDSG
jgi:hypothetical protein